MPGGVAQKLLLQGLAKSLGPIRRASRRRDFVRIQQGSREIVPHPRFDHGCGDFGIGHDPFDRVAIPVVDEQPNPRGSGCTWTCTDSVPADDTTRIPRSARACATAEPSSASPSSATGATPSAEAADAQNGENPQGRHGAHGAIKRTACEYQRKGATIPTAPAHLLIPPRQHRVVVVLRGC